MRSCAGWRCGNKVTQRSARRVCSAGVVVGPANVTKLRAWRRLIPDGVSYSVADLVRHVEDRAGVCGPVKNVAYRR